jgi:hypothetical protein
MEKEIDIVEQYTAEKKEDAKLYSKNAVRGFSIFFSTVFGGILLMQNLKDIGKKKEANLVLFSSIIITILSIVLLSYIAKPGSSATLFCNLIGGVILSEYFYRKYIPNEATYEKKTIWKPLIISILITIPFVFAVIYEIVGNR